MVALVFKTSGGFEQSSQWVRFPYTPAYTPATRAFEADHGDGGSARPWIGVFGGQSAAPTAADVRTFHKVTGNHDLRSLWRKGDLTTMQINIRQEGVQAG